MGIEDERVGVVGLDSHKLFSSLLVGHDQLEVAVGGRHKATVGTGLEDRRVECRDLERDRLAIVGPPDAEGKVAQRGRPRAARREFRDAICKTPQRVAPQLPCRCIGSSDA